MWRTFVYPLLPKRCLIIVFVIRVFNKSNTIMAVAALNWRWLNPFTHRRNTWVYWRKQILQQPLQSGFCVSVDVPFKMWLWGRFSGNQWWRVKDLCLIGTGLVFSIHNELQHQCSYKQDLGDWIKMLDYGSLHESTREEVNKHAIKTINILRRFILTWDVCFWWNMIGRLWRNL